MMQPDILKHHEVHVILRLTLMETRYLQFTQDNSLGDSDQIHCTQWQNLSDEKSEGPKKS